MYVKSKFTIIELMVVIAVIGVLMSLLLPSLRKARLATMSSVCKNNLNQLFLAETNYTSNNKGRITPANIGFYSFDDLLADYMGRDLTNTQKDANLLLKSDATVLNNQSLVCPNDTTERSNTGWQPRSYLGNGRRKGMPVLENDDSWGPMREAWAPFAAQVGDSSGTISFTERHEGTNYAGRVTMSVINKAEQLVSTDGWASPHGDYLKYNFIYWDGHVVGKHVDATCNSRGNPSGKEWSLDPSD